MNSYEYFTLEDIKMSKKVSPEIEQEIIKLYQSGLSMAKAGAAYEISGATVMAILNRNNIPKRTKGGIVDALFLVGIIMTAGLWLMLLIFGR